MRHYKAFVGLFTVLFSVAVTGSNKFEHQVMMKCMKDNGIENLEILKEIFDDETGSFPEEQCLRQCLYKHLGLVGSDGTVNISAVKHVYTLRHMQLSDQMIEKCTEMAEEHRDDICAFAVEGAHCYVGKVKFQMHTQKQ